MQAQSRGDAESSQRGFILGPETQKGNSGIRKLLLASCELEVVSWKLSNSSHQGMKRLPQARAS